MELFFHNFYTNYLTEHNSFKNKFYKNKPKHAYDNADYNYDVIESTLTSVSVLVDQNPQKNYVSKTFILKKNN